jgi:hypothetical protein
LPAGADAGALVVTGACDAEVSVLPRTRPQPAQTVSAAHASTAAAARGTVTVRWLVMRRSVRAAGVQPVAEM